MGIPISLNGLTGNEGWVLAEPILNSYGQVLYPENKPLDYTTIEHLKNHFSKLAEGENKEPNIKVSVKFNFDKELENKKYITESITKQNCDIDDIISTELKNRTIEVLSKAYDHNTSNIEDILNIIYTCVDDISQKIRNNPELSYSLGQYKEKGNDLNITKAIARHAFRVAQFSIALAIIYNKQVDANERISLKDIGIAALLHDYGLCFDNKDEMEQLKYIKLSDTLFKSYPTIPKDVLNQPFQKKYKNVYAYAALKDVLNSNTLTTILLSNEDEKGASSLNIINNKTTSSAMAAKIIFLCNLYDSLLLNTISNNENLENVSSLLEAFIANGLVNNTLGNLFINNIPLYSVGVRVELSNGEYATVVERFNGKYSSKPIVETLTNPPFIPEVIDLRKITNITIKRIVASSELLDEKIKEITQNQLETLGITSIESYRNTDKIEEPELISNKRR